MIKYEILHENCNNTCRVFVGRVVAMIITLHILLLSVVYILFISKVIILNAVRCI